MTQTRFQPGEACRNPQCPGRSRVKRPRGLCYSCFARVEVRVRYAKEYRPDKNGHVKSRVSAAAYVTRPVPPAAPTRHAPGTPEKVAVMAARVARGELLFHPLDGRGG